MIVEEPFQLIGQLAREGIPIVLVAQNVRQAIRLTTRYYLIERGRVVAQGDYSNEAGRAALLSRISVSDGPAGLGCGACGQQWHAAARASRPSVIAVRRHRPQAHQMAAQNGEESGGGRTERPSRIGHGHDLPP